MVLKARYICFLCNDEDSDIDEEVIVTHVLNRSGQTEQSGIDSEYSDNVDTRAIFLSSNNHKVF